MIHGTDLQRFRQHRAAQETTAGRRGSLGPTSRSYRRPLRSTIVGAIGCLLVLSACGTDSGSGAQQGDWPSFTLNHQDSRYLAESTITSSNVAKLHQSWVIRTKSSITSTPVVLDGNVYFDDWGGWVYSVRVGSGSINWKVRLKDPVSSTPVLANGNVYVGLSPYDGASFPPDNGNQVVALSQSDGHVLWQTELPSTAKGVWSSPIVDDGFLFIGLAAGIGQQESIPPFVGGSIWALDATTGRIAWKRVLNGTAGGGGLWGSVAVSTSLDSIFFGTANSYVPTGTINDAYSIVSLNLRTGHENWRFRAYPSEAVGNDQDFGATPNVFSISSHGGVRLAVGVGSKDGNYYVVDARTGALIQKVSVTPDGGNIGTSAFRGTVNPKVFVPTYTNAIDIASPANCCGGLVAVNTATGHVQWYVSVGANVIGDVAAVPNAVLFGDEKGNVYALSSKDGHRLFHDKLPDAIESGVTPAEGHVFVATTRGDPGLGQNDSSMPLNGLGLYAYVP